MYPSVNVLLVEDNPGDARLIEEAMNENRLDQFSFKHAARMSEALDRLDSVGIDVILLDLGLPDSQGLETLAKACKAGQGIPVIVLTGRDDESLAIDAVRTLISQLGQIQTSKQVLSFTEQHRHNCQMNFVN